MKMNSASMIPEHQHIGSDIMPECVWTLLGTLSSVVQVRWSYDFHTEKYLEKIAEH